MSSSSEVDASIEKVTLVGADRTGLRASHANVFAVRCRPVTEHVAVGAVLIDAHTRTLNRS